MHVRCIRRTLVRRAKVTRSSPTRYAFRLLADPCPVRTSRLSDRYTIIGDGIKDVMD